MKKRAIPFQIATLFLLTEAASFAQDSGSIFDRVTQQRKSTNATDTAQTFSVPSSSSTLPGQSSSGSAATAPVLPTPNNPAAGTTAGTSSFAGSSFGQNSNSLQTGMTNAGMNALNRYAPGVHIPGLGAPGVGAPGVGAPGAGSPGQLLNGTTGSAAYSKQGQKMYPGIPGHYAPMNGHGSLMDWALPQGYRPGTAAREAEAKQGQGQGKQHPWGWYPRDADCSICGSHHNLNDPCPVCGWGQTNVPCKHSWYHEPN